MSAKKSAAAVAAKKAPKAASASAKKAPEAPSKAPAKKRASKKVAMPGTVPASASPCGGLTRIIAKFDAGWGNSLFIRGSGAGLSWQKGVMMQCTDSDEWIWENKIAKGAVEFKILINDEAWSLGDDISVNAGETITCRPSF